MNFNETTELTRNLLRTQFPDEEVEVRWDYSSDGVCNVVIRGRVGRREFLQRFEILDVPDGVPDEIVQAMLVDARRQAEDVHGR